MEMISGHIPILLVLIFCQYAVHLLQNLPYWPVVFPTESTISYIKWFAPWDGECHGFLLIIPYYYANSPSPLWSQKPQLKSPRLICELDWPPLISSQGPPVGIPQSLAARLHSNTGHRVWIRSLLSRCLFEDKSMTALWPLTWALLACEGWPSGVEYGHHLSWWQFTGITVT